MKHYIQTEPEPNEKTVILGKESKARKQAENDPVTHRIAAEMNDID
jgi:hypothetical protein